MTAVGPEVATEKPGMTIDALLHVARARLGQSSSAALDARLLLEAATGITHAEIIAEPYLQLSEQQMQTFNAFITRRMAHEPVSRILGTREFYGRSFIVTDAVLDPRADTECVIELALKLVKQGRFIDLGTGSGAIAITLCAENHELSGVASDLSAPALSVAKANAENLGIVERLDFHHGAWLEGVTERFDLIISNPPYIRDDANLPPDVARFDPHLALFGGADGLQSYCAIAQQSRRCLNANGLVVVEIGHQQAHAVSEIFVEHGFKYIDEAIDIAGYTRGLAFQLA